MTWDFTQLVLDNWWFDTRDYQTRTAYLSRWEWWTERRVAWRFTHTMVASRAAQRHHPIEWVQEEFRSCDTIRRYAIAASPEAAPQ